MKITRVILQARLSSSRLPSKCLLPVAEMPLIVLAAKRAANTGLPVVVATSKTAEDEILAKLLRKHGIQTYSGSLDDVFSRFVECTNDLDDDEWVVRLTGDNCFPDGAFIEELGRQAVESGCQFISTSSPSDGLPYGLSAEVFKVGALRSVGEGLTDFDKEHVTPAIRRQYGLFLANFSGVNLPQLRCTVDTKVDYFRILSLFSTVENPIGISWLELCERLAGHPSSGEFRIPWTSHDQGSIGKLTLGCNWDALLADTVNASENENLDDCFFKILDTAVSHGVTHVDTTFASSDAASRIGKALNGGLYSAPTVVTKLDFLNCHVSAAKEPELVQKIEAFVFRRLYELKLSSLPVVMLRQWADYGLLNGIAWETLVELKNSGVVGRLGVCVQNPEEAIEALQDPAVTDLEIPFNLLDYRWREGPFAQARFSRPDVVVYASDTFLRGLRISDEARWQNRHGLCARSLGEQIKSVTSELRRESVEDFYVAYMQASTLIDTSIIKVENVKKLRYYLKLACREALTKNEMDAVAHRSA